MPTALTTSSADLFRQVAMAMARGVFLVMCAAGQLAAGAKVLQNAKMRVGAGTANSIIEDSGALPTGEHDAVGGPDQPYVNLDGTWTKLTYQAYPMNFHIKHKGDDNPDDELDIDAMCGTSSSPPGTMSYTDFVTDSSAGGVDFGHGTIVSTCPEISTGGKKLKLERAYTIWKEAMFESMLMGEITVTATDGDLDDVEVWIGTKDDSIGSTDNPTKEIGKLTYDGRVVQDANGDTLRITSGSEGVLFTTNAPDARAIVTGFDSTSFNPISNLKAHPGATEVTADSAYGLYIPLGKIKDGKSVSATWVYGAGKLADMKAVAKTVAAASVQQPTCSQLCNFFLDGAEAGSPEFEHLCMKPEGRGMTCKPMRGGGCPSDMDSCPVQAAPYSPPKTAHGQMAAGRPQGGCMDTPGRWANRKCARKKRKHKCHKRKVVKNCRLTCVCSI